MKENKRLYALDYLRGLAALGIMIYHYLSWEYGTFEADTFLGRIGIYGVAVFYVLSGLTLYHVYFHKMKLNFGSFSDFYIKRIFRIFPLLWLVMLITIYLAEHKPDGYRIFLNFTGLFGVLGWEKYIGVGVWSIGNELVFYLFFAVFIVLSKKQKGLFYILSAAILLLHFYFAFYMLQEEATLSRQWATYVNPLNQVFLFLAGYLIGWWWEGREVSLYLSFTLLVLAVTAFIFYPVEGDQIMLVTNANRLVFTGICLLLCFAIYKTNFTLPQFLHRKLRMLGEASYSVYLLHPIVLHYVKLGYAALGAQYMAFSLPAQLYTSALLTLLISYQVYIRFEKLFMRAGKSAADIYRPAV
ncbi:acyltransferase [Cesiribacter sp. SM1]|uniref:acyltransferase family protein n=1 Tax=Cesiribacter sp. SM1 TaxID=2861196 RepID=UPI001CD76B24|nr:acyltransferase [Cesiribacter sp. SM1]